MSTNKYICYTIHLWVNKEHVNAKLSDLPVGTFDDKYKFWYTVTKQLQWIYLLQDDASIHYEKLASTATVW